MFGIWSREQNERVGKRKRDGNKRNEGKRRRGGIEGRREEEKEGGGLSMDYLIAMQTFAF